MLNNDYVDTPIGSLPKGWGIIPLKEAIIFEKASLNPQSFPKEEFDYYSIPAYTEYGEPVKEYGGAIRSQKLIIDKGTVLFGKLNPRVPKIWHVTADTNRRKIASTEFIPLKCRDGLSDDKYIYFLAWSEYLLPKAQELVSGSTPSRQRVDTSAFLDVPVPIPPLPEQRAIAHVLSVVSQTIATTDSVIAMTHEFKRSLMKYLFTYGPLQVDLADNVQLQESWFGTCPSEWGLPKVHKVTTEQRRRNKELLFGRNDVLTVNNLVGFIPSEYQLGKDLSMYKIVGNRQFAYNPMRLNVGSIAFRNSQKSGIVSPDYIVFRCNEEDLLPEFFNQFRFTKFWWSQIRRSGQGSVRIRYYYHHIADFTIPLPSLGEQYKIAEMLDCVDNKIQSENKRRSSLQDLFNSLLHHLMTGKIRVKY